MLKFICIDVANGYSEHFVNFVQQTRKQYPDKVIIAGNVVTGEMVEELLLAGADIIHSRYAKNYLQILILTFGMLIT